MSIAATQFEGSVLNRHAYYLHWGVVQISLTNFIVIILMLVLFVLALVLPFPRGKGSDEEHRDDR